MDRKDRHTVPALTRRSACLGLGAAALATSMRPVRAAAWPTRPVTIVVPYAAGGNTDTMARLAAKYLSEKLGQNFVVDNRAGGGGLVGAVSVSQALPDGHTLLFGAATQIVQLPMTQKVAYDPDKDLLPISIFGAGPYLLGIKSSLPAKTLQEFIAHVKANPGKLNYATAGIAGGVHLNSVTFLTRAGLDMVPIPYKSGAPAMTGLLAGEVDMYFGNASEVIHNIDHKAIRVLAVSTLKRLPQVPNVPTVAETFPGYDTSSWNGFFAPGGTPVEVLDAIQAQVAAAARDPAIVTRLNQLTILPFGNTREEFRKVIAESKISSRAAMKAAGLPIIN
jgi:tripartite-type tricarboxylate transporter receptor subunit TctC